MRCECVGGPTLNLSAEEPDEPVFIGRSWNPPTNPPPLGGVWTSPSCIGLCISTISQEAADDCARELAVLCTDGSGPGGVRQGNDPAECSVPCPDGQQQDEPWTIGAGIITGPTLGWANAYARSLACQRARQNLLCIGALPNTCVNAPYDAVVSASGVHNTGADNFWHSPAGMIPLGLTFDGGTGATSRLHGTPTVAGNYSFTIALFTADGQFASKDYEFVVLGIDQGTLPAGTAGTAYSQQLTTTGGTASSQAWSLASGSSLPTGLTLSATGLISGTPTAGGTFTFDVVVLDTAANVECLKTLSLTIAATLLAYWTFDNVTGVGPNSQTVHSQTGVLWDLDGGGDCTQVPGKVALGGLISNTTTFVAFGEPSFATPSQGFTVAGWFKMPATVTDAAANLWLVNFAALHYVALELYKPAATQLLRAFWNGGSEEVLVPYTPDDTWHFIRFWYDGAKLNLQIDNGTVNSSAPFAFTDSAFDEFDLGGNATIVPDVPCRNFDELGFWKRALTDAEAASLWNGGAGITWGNSNMPG